MIDLMGKMTLAELVNCLPADHGIRREFAELCDMAQGDPWGDLVASNRSAIADVQRRSMSVVAELVRQALDPPATNVARALRLCGELAGQALGVHPHYPESFPDILRVVEAAQKKAAAIAESRQA